MRKTRGRSLLVCFLAYLIIAGFFDPKAFDRVQVLGCFVLAVAVHELGHLYAALKFGVKVHSFSVFFGPHVYSKMYNGVEVRIGSIPIGGYVAVKGVPDGASLGDSLEEKVWWQQLVFAAAGPAMNILSGILVLTIVICLGGMSSFGGPAKIGQVKVDSLASSIGLREGDVITSLNEKPINSIRDFLKASRDVNRDVCHLTAVRDQEDISVELKSDSLVALTGDFEFQTHPQPVITSFFMATSYSASILVALPVRLFSHARELLSDPGSVISLMSEGPKLIGMWHVGPILGLGIFFGLLSYGLAAVNLIPLPGLDGGEMLFAALKGLRIEPSPKIRQVLVVASAVLVLGLTAWGLLRDLLKLFV